MRKKIEDYADILSARDVRDILKIGFNKTYELLNKQAIKNFKIGRERKIPKKYLIEYIESQISEE